MLSNRIGEIHCLVESTRKPKTVNRPKFIQGASSSVCQHIHITSSEHTWILVVYLLFCFEPIPKLRVCRWIVAGIVEGCLGSNSDSLAGWLEVEEWHLSARCGREGVDGARNWFPAAARLQLQHQQHSGRHQIPTLPLDLWLTTIMESSSFNPKVIVALSSALGMLCRPAELQLLLGKAGKLMRLRSPVLVRRGT